MTTTKHKFSHEDYLNFRELIYRRTGLHFPESKKKDLERIILRVLCDSEQAAADEYFNFINQISSDHREMKRLVNELTIGETYFFRDDNQMAVIKNDILAPLIAEKNVSTQRFKIWSAGCASGEEPYSIAMIVRDLIPYTRYWDIKILATDINRVLLKKAKAATYNNWSFRNTSDEVIKRYFTFDDREYNLVSEIKEMVTFDYLNLVESIYPSTLNLTGDFDLIICRNVAIYFDKETTRRIVERFYDCLVDGGWLLMGASDPLIQDSRFKCKELSGVFIYHKEKRQPAERAVVSVEPKKKKSNLEIQTEKLSATLPLIFSIPPATGTTAAKAPSASRKSAKYSYYSAGLHLFHSGKSEDALNKFYLGVEENDEPAKCAYMIAKIEANKGNLDEAKKWCKKAVASDKLLMEGHFLLSMIYQGLQKDEPAVVSLKKAIYIDHDFAEGYFCLGTIYKKQGKMELARKAFNNAVMLLESKPPGKEIPECEGMTFGKLLKCARENINNGID